MLRNFYLVLLFTLPFSICYNYDIDEQQIYQPKMNKKVRGRRKYYDDEEVQSVDRRSFEGYFDDKEPMAQLDLMSFLKRPSEDFFADSIPEPNIIGGIFSKNTNSKRGYMNKVKLSQEVPHIVSVDKINPKRFGNLNNFDENNNIQERNVQSKETNADSDSVYKEEYLNVIKNINSKQYNANSKFDRKNNQRKAQNKYKEPDIIYKNNKMKSKTKIHPKRYNFNRFVFDGTAKQKNSLNKDKDNGSDAVFKDEKPKYSKNNKKQGKPEKRKLVKRFKFPFFSHDKPDTKRHKKRKLFCGCNTKKQTLLLSSTLKPEEITPIKNAKVLKRSFEEKLCPMCHVKFISEIKCTKKRSPMIHNSRQYFKFLSKKKGAQESMLKSKDKDSKENETLEKDADSEEAETNEQKDNEDPGDDKLEDPNEYSRSKRQQPSFDRIRQLKELDEVQRKVDGVEIKGIMTKRPEYS